MQDYTNQNMILLQHDSWNRYVLENAELIENLSHLLKGEIQIPIEKEIDGEKVMVMEWIKNEDNSPPMNKKGYYFTMLHMSEALNKTNSTGYVDEEKALLLVNHTLKALVSNYIININEYELGSTSNIRSIVSGLGNLLVMHFSKSIEMKLVEKLTTSTNIQEQKITTDQKRQTNVTM